MALPSPPSSISLEQVNIELGNPGTSTISMNDAAVRTLFAVPTGEISMSDGYGKSSVTSITGITVTMPHPQSFLPGIPGPLAPRFQYNAGPIPGSAPQPPGFAPAGGGSSCSPNPIARQIVFNNGSPPSYAVSAEGYSTLPAPVKADVRKKDVTVSYTGGPSPGTNTDATQLNWSISTDCPVYSPTSGWSSGPATPQPAASNFQQPTAIPIQVLSTSAPKIVVDVGISRLTRGGAAEHDTGSVNGPYHPIPFPGSPAIPGPSGSYYRNNIHTRYVVTGTAPAPLGGASGSTSWGVICLPMDTEVTMEDGSIKLLGDIRVGDKVKTFDPDTNEISSNEVTHLLKRHVASELIHVHLENDIVFKATSEHECWVKRGDEGMWIMAELIEEGDLMMTEGIKYQKVVKVERVEYEEGIEVGNISVADAHVYFANKVLLHNFTGL